jgi:hypothetical protein
MKTIQSINKQTVSLLITATGFITLVMFFQQTASF